MADPVSIDKNSIPLSEPVGTTSGKISGGIVIDDSLPSLHGDAGRKIFKEMSENSAIIGAILFSVEMLLRQCVWRGEPSDKHDPEAVQNAEFLQSQMDDMDHTWDDFIGEVLSMLVFGWSYHEMVFKRRSAGNSKHPDGRIGLHSLPIRAQESLHKWEMADDNSTVLGMWQYPYNVAMKSMVFIPINRSLHFKAHTNNNLPEGRSAIRRAYRPWYMLKNIEDIEAVGIERELNGLPVLYVPGDILRRAAAGEKTAVAAIEQYKKVVRDVKINAQGGVILPSDPFSDAENRPGTLRKTELTLLSTNGQRLIDTNVTIRRYQMDIARSVLADFIMLGAGEKGSFALSKNKTDLYVTAVTGWNEAIADVFNRGVVPLLFGLNGITTKLPSLKPGSIAPEDLDEITNFVEGLSRAGFPLFPNQELEENLMGRAGLPKSSQSKELV